MRSKVHYLGREYYATENMIASLLQAFSFFPILPGTSNVSEYITYASHTCNASYYGVLWKIQSVERASGNESTNLYDNDTRLKLNANAAAACA